MCIFLFAQSYRKKRGPNTFSGTLIIKPGEIKERHRIGPLFKKIYEN